MLCASHGNSNFRFVRDDTAIENGTMNMNTYEMYDQQ